MFGNPEMHITVQWLKAESDIQSDMKIWQNMMKAFKATSLLQLLKKISSY